jgi:single-stranded-DNA-specific exonuclease
MRELQNVPRIRKVQAEAQVELKDLHPDLIKFFNFLEPVGEGNPKPLFVAKNIKPKHVRRIGKSGDHLKMTVTDGVINFDAVAFRFGGQYEDISTSKMIDILFSYELNIYNGRKTLQLNIKDIKMHGNDI